jgi:hypothetical protein
MATRLRQSRFPDESDDEKKSSREDVMQMAITFMAVVGGLIFSLAVALLAEELIFGQVFRLFFASGKVARQAVAVKPGQKR